LIDYLYSNYIIYHFKDVELPQHVLKMKDMFNVDVNIRLCILKECDNITSNLYYVAYIHNDAWCAIKCPYIFTDIDTLIDVPNLSQYLK
jgi:hypothetical protein